MLALILGGSGSGKSALAEALLTDLAAAGRRYYLATMAAEDAESKRRVQRHQKMRRGKGFETVEQPLGLERLLLPGAGGVLLECMSNLVANEMFLPGGSRLRLAERIGEGVSRLQQQAETVVIVSNNVFEDGVCYSGDTREYLRILAEVNRRIAARAQLVVEAVAGLPLVWKGRWPQECQMKNEAEYRKNGVQGSGLILISGGSGQGKRDWALRRWNLLREQVWDCESGALSDEGELIQNGREPIIFDGIHHLVHRYLRQELSMEKLEEALLSGLGGQPRILIVDEVGCGLVPVDAFERAYREAVGRLAERLAGLATEVYRVNCGLGMQLKGEKNG